MGVPTVSIATQAFVELAHSTAYKKGIPNLKVTFTPHPIAARTTEESIKYLNSPDPVSGNPMLAQIYAGLSEKVSAQDMQKGTIEREARQRFLPPDTPVNLQQMFHDKLWTDGLPIIMPTEEKVKEMLTGTSRDPDEIVGEMRPSGPHEAWTFTVEMVAINAVMAGARPEYLPIILAIAATGQSALVSSTSSFARMAVVNGPIRDEINMNSSIGALGPFNQANSAIGRAWLLLSKNLGGSGLPGSTYLGSQGTSINYNNMTYPEAEDGLPEGWEPLHVQHGFKKEDNVVSIFTGWSFANIAWFSPLPIHEVIKNWQSHFFSFGTTRQSTLVLDPTVAVELKNAGFETKQDFIDYLCEETTTPAWLYWSTHQEQYEQAKQGVEPYASYLKLGETAEIPVSRYVKRPARGAPQGSPERNPIEVVVVGGSTNPYWSGGDFGLNVSANIDEWR